MLFVLSVKSGVWEIYGDLASNLFAVLCLSLCLWKTHCLLNLNQTYFYWCCFGLTC